MSFADYDKAVAEFETDVLLRRPECPEYLNGNVHQIWTQGRDAQRSIAIVEIRRLIKLIERADDD